MSLVTCTPGAAAPARTNGIRKEQSEYNRCCLRDANIVVGCIIKHTHILIPRCWPLMMCRHQASTLFPSVDAVRLHQGDKLCLCTPMDSTFRNGVAPDPLFAQVRKLPTCKYCSCRTRICMHGVSRTSSWTDVSKPVR